MPRRRTKVVGEAALAAIREDDDPLASSSENSISDSYRSDVDEASPAEPVAGNSRTNRRDLSTIVEMNHDGGASRRATTEERSSTSSSRVDSLDDVDEASAVPADFGSRGRGRRRRGRSRATFAMVELRDDDNLFEVIVANPTFVRNIANLWIVEYKSSKDQALLMLLQLLVDATGAKFALTPEMIVEMDGQKLIAVITEEDEEDSERYPIVAAGQLKKFRQSYSDFLEALIQGCRNSIVFDRCLLDSMITLLIPLSLSQVRAYRHTAAFALMKLMIAVADVAASVSSDQKNIARQFEAETRKNRNNVETRRLQVLMTRRDDLQENNFEINSILEYLFKSVFKQRYVDVAIDIRAFCIADLGACILKYPEHFFNDPHLAYIGRSLYDSIGEVRQKCVEVLLSLFANADNTPKLQAFVRHYKDRIVAMMLDEDSAVGVQAVRLFTLILQHHPEVVTDEDCDKAYELVYAGNRDLAHAAGEFVNRRIFYLDEDTSSPARTRRGKQRSPNDLRIRDLLIFFFDSQFPRHAVFLVDSLIETNEMMKDWECMTDLLLEEPGPDEEALTNQNETVLTELMYCSAKQASTGETPVGREPVRKNVTAQQKTEIHVDKEKMTEHFIHKLPLLLEKYRADPDKLVHLLSLPCHFDLEMYTRARQEQKLDDLLEIMRDIVKRTRDVDVLGAAGKALEIMCSQELTINHRCDVARRLVFTDIVDSYGIAHNRCVALFNESRAPDEDDILDLNDSLERIAVLYSMHDLNSYNIWDRVWNTLDYMRFSHDVSSTKALCNCTRICFLSLIWRQASFTKSEDEGIETINAVGRTVNHLQSFLDLMMLFIGGDGNVSTVPWPQVLREEAFNTVCDLLVYFNEALMENPNHIVHQLVFTADATMQEKLQSFVQENVFAISSDDNPNEDEKIEQLHKRRNFLAGYCKLVLNRAVPHMLTANILKHYMDHYDNYGDVLKALISQIRDGHRTTCAHIVARTLMIAYDEMIAETGDDFRNSRKFTAIKALARRLNLLFGIDIAKNSQAFVTLHGDGVVFAIQRPEDGEDYNARPGSNLAFLEILVEFSGKLLKEGKREVLNFLNLRLENNIPPRRGEWKSLHIYRDSLIRGTTVRDAMARSESGDASGIEDRTAGEDDAAETNGARRPIPKSKRKTRPRKSKLPVTKVAQPRGARARESEESQSMSTGMPAIDDSSEATYNATDEGLNAAQPQSTTGNSPRLFED